MNLIPTIIAGGSGTRLWPLSRRMVPKQFNALTSDQSMMSVTINRLEGIAHDALYIVGNHEHQFLLAEELGSSSLVPTIFLEPCKRNTAPAIALAAFHADPSDILLIFPADQAIANQEAFLESIENAVELATNGHLTTMGVIPTSPHTGYGYIQAGKPNKAGYDVTAFVEKPDQAVAKAYVASGDYYWNSGMFVFSAGQYLAELELYRPNIFNACQRAYDQAIHSENTINADKTEFENCPSESVDYAVMENTKTSAMVPLDAGWSDIGSWQSLRGIQPQDANGNVLVGDVVVFDTQNSYIRASDRLVVASGLTNQIVIDTKDALLVTDVNSEQGLTAIVEKLETTHNQKTIDHRKVRRPWGTYDSVDIGETHQVKRIRVNPGARLSRQSHTHRAEHWIVVNGEAEVYKDGEISILLENESIFLPKGCIHSLGNSTNEILEIIEVQYGSYLGEDDIVRYADLYGRVTEE